MEPALKNIEETTSTQQQPTAYTEQPGVVLLVDDDRVTLMILECFIAKQGHEVLTARDGREALEIIRARNTDIDLIILDFEMPSMNGDDLMRVLQQDARMARIPVIMQTGLDRPDKAREAIEAGYFYYLTKPMNQALMNSVLAAAMRESHLRKNVSGEILSHQKALSLVDTCRFRLRTLPEAESLALLMAGAFPNPERAVAGLAELLINAVEHGNIGLGYEEKSRLLESRSWRDEVMRRSEMPENKNKYVDVLLQRKSDRVYVQITDQGNGFDWKAYMSIDPSRAASGHGRGIARASAQCFDDIRYNAAGNQVTVATNLGTTRVEAISW